nr:unnamed protein product [Naegleria fowleri]
MTPSAQRSQQTTEHSPSNHKGVVFSASQLEALEQFVNYVKANPQIIREGDEFKFFRDFLIHDCGATKLIVDPCQQHAKTDQPSRLVEERPKQIPKQSKPLILEVSENDEEISSSQQQQNGLSDTNEPLLIPCQTKILKSNSTLPEEQHTNLSSSPPSSSSCAAKTAGSYSELMKSSSSSLGGDTKSSHVGETTAATTTISSPTLTLADSKYLNNMGRFEFGISSSTTKNSKLANEYTSKGNQLLKEKQFELAAIHYGKSIELQNGESALLFIKRAECMAMLNKPLSVRRDCDAAITLNPDAGKAYRLRAKAYFVLRKYEQARDDLEMSKKLEDDTSEANKLLKEIEKVLPNSTRSSSNSTSSRSTIGSTIGTRTSSSDNNSGNNNVEPSQPSSEKKKTETMSSSSSSTPSATTSATTSSISPPISSCSTTTSKMSPPNHSKPSNSNSETTSQNKNQKSTIYTKPQPEPSNKDNSTIPNFVNPQVMKLVAQDETLMRGFQNPRIVNAINEIAVNPNAFMKYNNDPEVVTMFKKFTQIITNSK